MAISSSAASSSSSAFNVDGIVSGLKTADLITSLMKLAQAPLNQLTAQQTKVQARDAAYQAISSQMITFQGSVQNLLLSTSVNAKISASSAPLVATATSNATAINGNFSVNVIKLATATAAASSGALGIPANLASGTTLANSGMALLPTAGNITINGQSIAVNANDTWSALQSRISTATSGAVTLNLGPNVGLGLATNAVSLTSTSSIQIGAPSDTSNFLGAANLLGAAQTGAAGAYTIASRQLLGAAQTGNPLSTAGLNVAGGIAASGSFSINGVAIKWANTDSLNGILTRINSSTAGVVATYDPKLDKINLTNTNTGAQNISLVDAAGSNLLLALHLTGASSSAPLGTAPDLNPATVVSAATGFTTPPTAGTFTVNGHVVTVGAGDKWSDVQASIFAATSGAVSLVLGSSSASLTSSSPVQLGAVGDTSNMLQALQLTGAAQASGVAAQYTTTQNGVTSATQFSNSNTVGGMVQGVNVSMLTTGTTNLSTTQDTATATTNVQTFITQFNSMVDLLDTDTKYDSTTGKGAILAGDSAVTALSSQLRALVSRSGLVPAGSLYNTMGDIGISTGAYGSAIGSTNHLVLDTGKLTAALQNNPQAVSQLMSGLTGTTTLASDASHPWIQTETGTPFGQVSSGTYKVTYTPNGANGITLKSIFTSSNGTSQPAVTGTIAAGGTNTTLIPGVSLVARGVLPMFPGTDTISYTVSGRGVLQTLNDYVNTSRGPQGIFTSEHNDATSSIASLATQIANQNQLLATRHTSLQAQFTAMEVALGKLQSQSSALTSSISSLSNTQSSTSTSA